VDGGARVPGRQDGRLPGVSPGHGGGGGGRQTEEEVPQAQRQETGMSEAIALY